MLIIDAILITEMMTKNSRTFIKIGVSYLPKIGIKPRNRISSVKKVKHTRSVIALKTKYLVKGKHIQNNSLRLKVVSSYNLGVSLKKGRF